MTRIVKSDDDELEEAAEEFLLFHDEAPEEEAFVQISFDTTPLLDADSKFLTDYPPSNLAVLNKHLKRSQLTLYLRI